MLSSLADRMALAIGWVFHNTSRARCRLAPRSTSGNNRWLTTARRPDELITAVRFPVLSGRVAFREVARRHGDFAIVAVAALVDSAEHIRLGVAGMAERPAVRQFEASDDGGVRDAIERLAWELEGYEDIHASARMRRDLLRRIGPVVVDEAMRCAA